MKCANQEPGLHHETFLLRKSYWEIGKKGVRREIVVGRCPGILLVVRFTRPALAWRYGLGRRGGWSRGFWPGYAVGAFPGLAAGTLAAPYVPWVPVYVVQPPPRCHAQPGYWSQVPIAQGNGFTTHQHV